MNKFLQHHFPALSVKPPRVQFEQCIGEWVQVHWVLGSFWDIHCCIMRSLVENVVWERGDGKHTYQITWTVLGLIKCITWLLWLRHYCFKRKVASSVNSLTYIMYWMFPYSFTTWHNISNVTDVTYAHFSVTRRKDTCRWLCPITQRRTPSKHEF